MTASCPGISLALLLFTAGLFAAGCDSSGDPGNEYTGEGTPPAAEGLAYVKSSQNVRATARSLVGAFARAEAVSEVVRVDYASSAHSIGEELPPTRLLVFGNPVLGTPLMQADPRAGIDLPQKMLVYRDSGDVFLTYNTTDYLAARHALGEDSTLSQIDEALQSFAEGATGAEGVERRAPDDIEEGEGLVEVESAFSVDSTYARLQRAVEDRDSVSVVAEVNHAENAASVDLELPPTRLLVFGNSNLGTPLIQEARSAGIDLPQKALVYEDATGAVFLAYNDPLYVAQRHGVEGRRDVIEQISVLMEELAQTATSAADATSPVQ